MTCFIDSNGHLGELAWQRVLPVTDGVMLDIKAFDNGTHMALTGRCNRRSLASARSLHAHGKLFELRYLMIPAAPTPISSSTSSRSLRAHSTGVFESG